jgi:hypothetical protein
LLIDIIQMRQTNINHIRGFKYTAEREINTDCLSQPTSDKTLEDICGFDEVVYAKWLIARSGLKTRVDTYEGD